VHHKTSNAVSVWAPNAYRAFETGSELRAGLSRWIGYYNARRPHSSLAGRTPDEAYEAGRMERLAA